MLSEKSALSERIKSLVLVGNYLPRKCGIATFTTDLLTAFTTVFPDTACWAVAMNDTSEGYAYPREVRFEVAQNIIKEYQLASDFLNMSSIDVVCLQHEYGIFGGESGVHVLKMLQNIRKPLVTTLHTVLKDPTQVQKEILTELGRMSDRLIVMNPQAIEMLKEIYGIPDKKIVLIHHGVPDLSFIDPNFYKDQFGVEGKKVLLTFGLLSPDKGIEYMIDALPAILKECPDTVYIVLGATHPHVQKEFGNSYQISLVKKAREKGVHENVIFHNRFVELEELCQYLGSTDIYITPYLNENQIVSGTLAYALGSGKAVVSTPYWYAQEMLADGRGVLVPFRDSEALAKQIILLLKNETKRHSMRKKAYLYCRQMVWKEVARSYFEVFNQVIEEHKKKPYSKTKKKTVYSKALELPDVKLNHLKLMTDDTGILQHAKFTIPNRFHGYCTDDNARALIVAVEAHDHIPESELLTTLVNTYLSFIDHAFNDSNGRFRNFMSFDRKWLEDTGSEDCHGRAIWSLGEMVAMSKSNSETAMELTLFKNALPAMETFTSPRAWALGIIGIHKYLSRFGGDSEARRMQRLLAKKLYNLYKANSSSDWLWIEETITYLNGKIPEALILAGSSLKTPDLFDAVLQSLQWLLNIQTDPDAGHFIPIGNNGWFPRNGSKARFDQQPVEALALIDACITAYNYTNDEEWEKEAWRCFDWFFGRNDFNIPVYDFTTGGCFDGLQPTGLNQNQGAESTLSWLLALLRMNALQSRMNLQLSNHPIPE